MDSLWTKTAQLTRFVPLAGDRHTDVLIIGGGMAGLLCSYFLTRAGIDNLVLEAGPIAGGVTKNTTAKLTSQHGMIYHKLVQRFGAETARLYYDANEDALAAYRRLCDGIDCDFAPQDACVYTRDDPALPEKEMRALSDIGIRARLIRDIPLPISTCGGIRFSNQAQFHPLKFLSALTPGLRICEHTPVRELAPHRAVTDFGTVRAEKIIIATHFPMLNKHGSFFLKLYQHRSYVLALENAGKLDAMYVDEADKGLSFRNYKDLMLLGGGDHRTGKIGGNYQELEDFARVHYPGAVIRYHWAAQDCMSLDGVPYIGPYSRHTEGLYVATGFNKWGMTGSMAAALLLTDLVQGKDNPYARLFSPSRSILRSQLAVNAWEAGVNLLTPTPKRCPHLGCALKWNPAEHSWDCPCHGSRFDSSGHLLEGPAQGDLKS